MSDEDQKFDARVATLETEVQTVVSAVDKLTRKIDSQGDEFWRAINALKDMMAARDKPNYSAILGIASFGLAFVMAVGGAAFTPLHIRNNYMEAQQFADDKRTNERIDAMESEVHNRFLSLDTLIQREMRDLDARIVDRVQHNERWLEKLMDRQMDGARP